MPKWDTDHYLTMNFRVPKYLKPEVAEILNEAGVNWQNFLFAAMIALRAGEWELPTKQQLINEEQEWLALTGGRGMPKTRR